MKPYAGEALAMLELEGLLKTVEAKGGGFVKGLALQTSQATTCKYHDQVPQDVLFCIIKTMVKHGMPVTLGGLNRFAQKVRHRMSGFEYVPGKGLRRL